MSKDTGGSAFPINDTCYPNGQIQYGCVGMTLRDYFASKAMLGEINYQGLEGREVEHIAGMAYQMADAMLAERAKCNTL